MEESFRNSLIIISAIVIGGIFVHGLWTIRKNKNPYKLKAKPKDVEIAEKKQRDFDRSGFDQDGVSQVKVVSNIDEENDTQKTNHTNQKSQDNVDFEIVDKVEPSFNISDDVLSEQKNTSLQEIDDDSFQNSKALVDEEKCNSVQTNVGEELELELATETSVYSDPVFKAKPVVLVKGKLPGRKAIKKSSKENIKRDQIEINFGDANANAIDDESFENKEEPNITSIQTTIEPEVLAISVITPQGQIISGAALLPNLLTLGMKFGEMDVFHRHEDNAGNGKVTFSLVNAMNPGTFDLDSMESFVTQGVSLFMTLPNAGNAFEVFDQMLIAAKQLASEFNGQLLDDKRSVLTKQTEQHYITRIRNFERKSRLASL